MTVRNIVIATGRCSRTKDGFGIRFERISKNQWSATWCFAIKESIAKKEGYEKTEMHGSFVFDPSFPGCPSCSSRSFFRCGCGKIACWDGENRKVKCPWCMQTIELNEEVRSLEGGSDR